MNSKPYKHPSRPVYRNERSHNWITLVAGLLFVGSLIAVCAFGSSLISHQLAGCLDDNWLKCFGLPVSTATPIPTPIPPSIVLAGLSKVVQIITVTQSGFASVVEVQENPDFIIVPIDPTTVHMEGNGSAQAGFDFTSMTVEQISTIFGIAGQEVTIYLPPPRVLSYGLQNTDVTGIYEGEIFIPFVDIEETDVRPETIDNASDEILTEIITAICAEGILNAANTNAQAAFEALLLPMGFAKVTVITQNPGACP